MIFHFEKYLHSKNSDEKQIFFSCLLSMKSWMIIIWYYYVIIKRVIILRSWYLIYAGRIVEFLNYLFMYITGFCIPLNLQSCNKAYFTFLHA